MQQNRFEKALSESRPIVLDGGLATEVESQGLDIGTKLWSAAALLTNPQAIINAHLSFLEAGAEIIISASYQASRLGFTSAGLSEQAADDLIVKSVELADQARQQFLETHPESGITPVVAASIGPYGATLHDGSEYTGKYEVGEHALREFHEARLQLLDRSGADVLACETIPNHSEARVLGELLLDVNLPAWVSFSCRDDRCISDGTPLQDVSMIFRDHLRVSALGVNCTAPHLITPLIGEIRQAAPDKAIVVYPNSGETYEVQDNSWRGAVSPIDCDNEARTWVSAGARIIGGCCRMGPRHIRAIHERLRRIDGDKHD